MPKQKISRGASKRFKHTGTGKIKRQKSSHSHILTKKTRKRKRRLRKGGFISKPDEKRIRRVLGK